METIKNPNVALVMASLEKFVENVAKTQNFNLQDFVGFMNPIFHKTGYRTPSVGERTKILIAAGMGIGDFITKMPAIREIRRAYPDAHITLAIPPQFIQIVENCPYVDELIFRQPSAQQFTFKTDFMVLPQLLERKIDIAFSFWPRIDYILFSYMSGARSIVAFNNFIEGRNYDVNALTYKQFLNLATNLFPAWKYGNHAVDMHLSLIDNILLAPVQNRELEFWTTIADKAMAKSVIRNLSRPLYALMLGASSPTRRYPTEKYAELVKMILSEEPTATFINVGGGDEDAFFAQILKERLGEKVFEKHVLNLVNKTSFRVNSEIVRFCDMYIGNNTGPMHLASIVKRPALVAECFPADLPQSFTDTPGFMGPYKVPTVSVQPAHALPGCELGKTYTPYGCRSYNTHCIAQISPATLFRGYKLIKEMVSKGKVEHLYIS